MEKRMYIFTGKGGVGKTSVASAHALKSAEEGIETLLVSTDMAHNLGDVFCIELGKEPVSVQEKLDVYEIDPTYVMEHNFSDMMASINKMIGQDPGEGREVATMFPGMEELFALLEIQEIYEKGHYDRIFVDCAPTGETLSLLKFPELLSWYMEKLFPIGKVAMRVLSPMAKKMYKVELPNKEAMTDIEKTYVKLFELQELLKNRDKTSIRLVSLPEKMVVEETKRSYMYMNLYNFNVDGLYINRLLPESIANPFFHQWLDIQQRYKKELYESFGALPIYEIPWYDEEIRGTHGLRRIASDALTQEEVFTMHPISDREVFETDGDDYILKVRVPFADKKDMDMYQSETDVVIKIHNFKRNIPLPNALRKYRIVSAKMDDEIVQIRFVKEVVNL